MFRLEKETSALVIIDMQERPAEAADPDMFETAAANSAILALSMKILGAPVIETLQDPEKSGKVIKELKESLNPDLRIEKTWFSAWKDEKFKEFLKNKGVKNVILAGMEAHIAVLQTALDLLDAGFGVHISADAVVSRNDFSWETGLDMAQRAGAAVTVTETVIYQLLGGSHAKEFKDIQRVISRYEREE